MNRLFLKAIYLIYCFTLLLANASLEQRQDHLEHNALRAKRKTQESSTSAVHFMEDLRSSLTDESGKPKLSNPDDPTEVWAMQDRGEKSAKDKSKLASCMLRPAVACITEQ